MKKFDSVDNYFETLENGQRFELERIRTIVTQVVPEAKEVISYGMPGFKYKNKYLVSYGAFKNHLSLFPGPKPVAELKNKLKNYITSKGTIQFSVDKPLPESLIKEILAIRVLDILAR
jgi:uncharacterized protein YdhG (YjbR/CyaY superfamily)